MHRHIFPTRLLTLVVILWASLAAVSRAQEDFTIKSFTFDDSAILNSMSDNGQWAVADAANPSNSLLRIHPRLIDLRAASPVVTELCADIDEASIVSAQANDVTDDGNLVVGSFNGMPAVWSKATHTWTTLPMNSSAGSGSVHSVTPDGHYAVGVQTDKSDEYKEIPALWDLTTMTLVPTPGLPTKDMAHENKGQNRFVQISADGKTILGCMSVSYLPTYYDLGGHFDYVYHVDTQSYTAMGFTETLTGRWTPHVDGLYYFPIARMSNNGRYVSGAAYIVQENEDSEFPTEGYFPFIYDTQADNLVVLTSTADNGMGAWIAYNGGTLLGATPVGSPFREWSILDDSYWVPFSLIAKEKGKFNFQEKTGFENTGTPLCVSDDGRSVCVLVDPYTSYVAQLPEDVASIGRHINLLGDYTVDPKAGTALSKLQTVTVTFSRAVTVAAGKATAAEIRDAQGNTLYTSIAVKVDATGKALTVTFRKGDLEAGKAYSLFLPAGTVHIAGDASRTNGDISIPYYGRAAVPVQLTATSPAEGATVARIDATGSPVLLTFDTDVKVSEGSAELYLDGEDIPVAQLLLAYADNRVAVYPSSTVYLYKGGNYTVKIPAGIITDLTGNNANEAFELHYAGAYEREVSYDDKILFSEDFNSGLGTMLLYDGDKQTPSAEMTALGFADGQNYPWWVVRNSETSTDMAAASHSDYATPGQSEDWMVVPQTYLPDRLCHLEFQGQSYLNSKADRLKVYVYESDVAYNIMTRTLADRILAEGTLVFDEQLSPGASEGGIDGEWTDYSIALPEFSGRNVYIAFLNDNTAQSLVMVDNVRIVHDLPYLVTFDNAESVVGQAGLTIKGRVTVDTADETFTTADLTLRNSAGETISEVHAEGLSLGKGDSYAFSFPQQLPLQAGRTNDFTVVVTLNETTNEVKGTVRNLAFEPQKNVVLEEYTGMNCVNCPLGILAIEKIRSLYGSRFIPVSLHNYPGDVLGGGSESYVSYLNFSAAPTGMVHRNGIISSPMASINGDYVYSDATGGKLWLDYVQDEFAKAAEAEISATAALSADGTTISVPATVRFALDTEGRNLNLLLLLLEDDVQGYQQSNLSGMTDPDLGEWAQGGLYGKAMNFPYYHEDVVRGWKGNSHLGTGGYLPAAFTAGEKVTAELSMPMPGTVGNASHTKVVVMLIDANNDQLINACVAPVQVPEGIQSTQAARAEIRVAGGRIEIAAAEEVSAVAYAADGREIASTAGSGLLTLHTGAARGVVVVKVTAADGSRTVRKIIL